MSIIQVTDLTFSYEGSYDTIFDHVSFTMDTDWKLGFTGRNGRGKTTFLRLLTGQFHYSGSITASVDFTYFPFPVSDMERDTLDVVYDICPQLEVWQLVRELALLEMPEETLYRPYVTLSHGERTKAQLAALFLRENGFLLIDEPTNHLDMHGREVVSRYLNRKKGFLLVSHDRAFLDGCIDHILTINKTNIEIQRGNFSSWLVNKERQDNYEITENDKLKKEIRRLEDSAREKAAWSDTAERRKIGFDPTVTEKSAGRRPYQAAKSKKMMKRVQAIEDRIQSAIEDKSSLLHNIERADRLKLTQLRYHAERLLSLEDVSVVYDTVVCGPVSFVVQRGERIALSGGNGTGKSSILKLLRGEDIPHTGSVSLGSQLTVSYVSQDTAHLSGNLHDYATGRGIDESLLKAILNKLDFSRIQLDKDMRAFSGGQKKKVLIAASLCEQAHLLLWDEPLNDIDVLSRIQIEQLLKEYSPTMVFVEHDRVFCDTIATRVVSLSKL